MNRATSATVCSNDATAVRDRARSSADVNRWVAMIDAELRSDEVGATDQDAVAITLEFGRTTIDLAAQPLKAGDSLRLINWRTNHSTSLSKVVRLHAVNWWSSMVSSVFASSNC